MPAFFVRHRAWLPLACAVVIAAGGCGGAESRKARHLEKGQAFLAAGNYEKARVEFRNALQIAPTDAEARFEVAVVDEKLGNFREAAQFYMGAIEANPDHVGARTALGRIYLFAGAPDKALETVTPSLDKHPDDAGLLTVRSAARLQLKDPSGALQDAERAFEIAPNNESAVAGLAGIYKSRGEAEKAQKLLQDAVKRIPATVDLRLALADMDAGMGRLDDAESLLIELTRLQPHEISHRVRLAQFYTRTDHTDAAERVLRDGVKAIPASRELKTALVDFLAARRSREAAQEQLDVFIAASPEDYRLRFEQAQLYEQGREFLKAESVYREVISAAKLDEAGLTARNRLAALRVQQKDIPGAEKLIAEVLAKSPRDDDALTMRGNLALAQSDPRSAIVDLRAVLRDQPNSTGVMRVLARAHLANGEPALAEETMRRAVEGNPQDAGARLDLAQLLTKLGKPDQAKPIIEELIRQQPTNMNALDTQFGIAMTSNDFSTAQSAAEAIVAARPKAAIGYFYEGRVADAEKRPEAAIQLYTKALQLEPQTEEPLRALTSDLVAQKRIPEALKRLDDVTAADPNNPIAADLKGEVLLIAKRPADAAAAFMTAIEHQPKWSAPYLNLSVTKFNNHDAQGAIDALKSGIEKGAEPPVLDVELATLYERLGKPDDAMAVYEAALRRDAHADVASNNLAMLLVTYKNDPVSLNRAKELSAHFASSDNPSYLDTYGWVLYKRGEASAAIAVLQTALAKSADSPNTLYHLGMAEALAGQAEAARDDLTRALQNGKKFPGMDEARATLDKLAKDASSTTAVPGKS